MSNGHLCISCDFSSHLLLFLTRAVFAGPSLVGLHVYEGSDSSSCAMSCYNALRFWLMKFRAFATPLSPSEATPFGRDHHTVQVGIYPHGLYKNTWVNSADLELQLIHPPAVSASSSLSLNVKNVSDKMGNTAGNIYLHQSSTPRESEFFAGSWYDSKSSSTQRCCNSHLIIMFEARAEPSVESHGFACQADAVLGVRGKWQWETCY